MHLNKYKADFYLVVHFLTGILSALYPSMIFAWVIGVFMVGVYAAVAKTHRLPEYLISAYLVGIELLARMSASGVPHEFIKYAISIIFIFSLLYQSRKLEVKFIVYFLVLLPAIILTDGGSFDESRQLISANLSGPLCLAVSAIYFFNRPVDTTQIRKIFLGILYPLGAILGYMVIKTPDLSEIEFGYQSNFSTSIYGPNQMSAILGLGIIILGVSYFLRIQLFGSVWITLAFLGMLLFRGLLTFSRGGMITPMVILLIVFVFMVFKISGFNRHTIRLLVLGILFFIISVSLFNYVNALTQNKLYERYTGKRSGKQIEDLDRLTSGRTIIMALDWEIFEDHPLTGIGVGMGKFIRHEYGYAVNVAAHNEFTRLLAEHGVLGIIALAILLFTPIFEFIRRRWVIEQILIISFIGFSFVFMSHAATRIAAPCFLYGLAFTRVIPATVYHGKYDNLFRKSAIWSRKVAGTS